MKVKHIQQSIKKIKFPSTSSEVWKKNIPHNALGNLWKKENKMRPVSLSHSVTLPCVALIDEACILGFFIHSPDASPSAFLFIFFNFLFVYSAGFSPPSAEAAGASSFFSGAGAAPEPDSLGSASDEVQRV